MNVTPRLLIHSVQFDGPRLNVMLIPQVVDDDGNVVGTQGHQQLTLETTEAITLSDQQRAAVEALILEQEEIKAPARPEIPAEPALLDADNKTELRAAFAGRPATPAVRGPRFDKSTVIAWQ